MLWISVAIGLVVSLIFAEFLGLAAGGLVVPGYIALFWDKPLQILGFLFGSLLRFVAQYSGLTKFLSLDPIGYVIPGLLAYWMEKQGFVETISALVVASVLVRFAIILINGGAPITELWF